jgi:hypothetical protein
MVFTVIIALTIAGLWVVSRKTEPVSATDQETLHVANQLYANGDYAGAAQLYQQLVDADIRNADLYYNLGNAYFQMDDMGRAILNYTRAQRLAPRDDSIKANLDLALGKVDANELAGSPLDRLVDFAQSTFALNEMALLAIVSALAALWLWQASRSVNAQAFKRVASIALMVSVLWFGFNCVALGATLYSHHTQPSGIVLSPTSINGVNLPSGTEVHILEQRDTTVRVALPGRNVEGWLSADSIGAI